MWEQDRRRRLHHTARGKSVAGDENCVDVLREDLRPLRQGVLSIDAAVGNPLSPQPQALSPQAALPPGAASQTSSPASPSGTTITTRSNPHAPPEEDDSTRFLTAEQRAIRDYVSARPEGTVVRISARAGAGKTTTAAVIAKAWRDRGEREGREYNVGYFVFNKEAEVSAQQSRKFPANTTIMTTHAWALRRLFSHEYDANRNFILKRKDVVERLNLKQAVAERLNRAYTALENCVKENDERPPKSVMNVDDLLYALLPEQRADIFRELLNPGLGVKMTSQPELWKAFFHLVVSPWESWHPRQNQDPCSRGKQTEPPPH